MAIRQDLSALLDKKMDRKDFLKHVGVAVVAMTGVAAIARAFAQSQQQQSLSKTSAATPTSGYGGSAYGGSKTS